MDSELVSVAHKLAERGWLPGIEWDSLAGGGLYPMGKHYEASEADLHLAAHRYITDPKRKWGYAIGGMTLVFCGGLGKTESGNDTTALLKCLLAACEAAGKETT